MSEISGEWKPRTHNLHKFEGEDTRKEDRKTDEAFLKYTIEKLLERIEKSKDEAYIAKEVRDFLETYSRMSETVAHTSDFFASLRKELEEFNQIGVVNQQYGGTFSEEKIQASKTKMSELMSSVIAGIAKTIKSQPPKTNEAAQV